MAGARVGGSLGPLVQAVVAQHGGHALQIMLQGVVAG